VKAHPDKSWDWEGLSRNPNITFEIVKAHPDKSWSWYDFSSNLFKLQNKLIEEKAKKEWLAVNKIKKNWAIVFWNPEYKIGQKRLLRSLETDE